MKKLYILFFIILFVQASIHAQVGIGTTSPQAEVHVSGASSTIRIESLDAVNNTSNDGVKLAPVYVDGNGSLSLGDSSGTLGQPPFDFLIEDTNFIPDNPYPISVDTGIVINNNDTGQTYVEGIIATRPFTITQMALIEVKFGVTLLVEGSDLSAGPPYTDIAYNSAVKLGLYFCVDENSNGLSAAEAAKKYALHGQYYETQYGGIQGYSYMNSDGYLTLPEGTHTIYFFGIVDDDANNYTSVGFGGAKDYLKIRIYN